MIFTDSHEWMTRSDEIVTVGISDYAQQELGAIVYVDLPKVGQRLTKDQPAAVLESTKAATDVYAPISGVVVSVNEEARANPGLINAFAESKGWLFQVKINGTD